MKKNNFEYILVGCHSFSSVAACYFPSAYTNSSNRSLRQYIHKHPALLADLLIVEYGEHDKMLSPLQIATIIRHMGMPGEANKKWWWRTLASGKEIEINLLNDLYFLIYCSLYYLCQCPFLHAALHVFIINLLLFKHIHA